MAGLPCKSFKVALCRPAWALSLPAKLSEVHIEVLICQSVCLYMVNTVRFPWGIFLWWIFTSLMSKRWCKKSHCGEFPGNCVFTLVRGRRPTQKKDGDGDEKSKAWKTHPAEVHEKRKEVVIVIIFSPVLFPPFFGPCKVLLFVVVFLPSCCSPLVLSFS